MTGWNSLPNGFFGEGKHDAGARTNRQGGSLNTFTRAIVRPPSRNFADGLTTADLGMPDMDRTLRQHAAYCEALERCGLVLTRLQADPRHPDSTFVEDTAVIAPGCTVLTRPGAASREGEVTAIRAAVEQFFPAPHAITAPGTLDGGDICEAGRHFFIGLSLRTNEEGARQLAGFLAAAGYTSSIIDIRRTAGILHLKSGVVALDDQRLVAIEALADEAAFRGYEVIRVSEGEEYAANCVRVNRHVLIAAGFPKLQKALVARGHDLVPLEMSEFQKMDGGLSCLSLRF
jgi:dimethylargininase